MLVEALKHWPLIDTLSHLLNILNYIILQIISNVLGPCSFVHPSWARCGCWTQKTLKFWIQKFYQGILKNKNLTTLFLGFKNRALILFTRALKLYHTALCFYVNAFDSLH